MDAVEISHDAGLYLCEFVYFKALYQCQKTGVPALFIHVPPSQIESDQAEIVQAVLKCIVHNLCHNMELLAHKNWKSKLFKWYLDLKRNFKRLFTAK